jgi:adenylosuccinate synthase
VNGLTSLAVTKLDVLDTLDQIAICTGYEVGGQMLEDFPGDVAELDDLKPRYEWFDGWRSPTADARKLEDLPRQARAYLDRIEQLVECPIQFVSVGTRRNQILETDAGRRTPEAA